VPSVPSMTQSASSVFVLPPCPTPMATPASIATPRHIGTQTQGPAPIVSMALCSAKLRAHVNRALPLPLFSPMAYASTALPTPTTAPLIASASNAHRTLFMTQSLATASRTSSSQHARLVQRITQSVTFANAHLIGPTLTQWSAFPATLPIIGTHRL
jgi:hypothetical protein